MNYSGDKPSISASIVLYLNPKDQVVATIRSLSSCPLPVRLIIIDNSPDDSLRAIVEGEGAEYIFNGKNIGFGAAHNIAIRMHLKIYQYHLILNPDVTFGPDTIPTLYQFMQNTPIAGLVMPKILYPDLREQRLCKLLPTPFDLIVRRFLDNSEKNLFQTRSQRYLLQDVDLTRIRFIPNLSGCFMFVRMQALQSVGLFDERFFLYMEDVDLCRRIGQYWDTIFFPKATITHAYANDSYHSLRPLLWHMISACKYFNKWGWFLDHGRRQANQRVLSAITSENDPL